MNTNPFVDPPLEMLAIALKDYTNGVYLNINPDAANNPAIREHRSYNDYAAPFDAYPLLKIHRLSEWGSLTRSKHNGQIVISYGLVIPEHNHLAALMKWVKDRLIEALTRFDFDHHACPFEFEDKYTATYRGVQNAVTQMAYMFLDISLTTKEY